MEFILNIIVLVFEVLYYSLFMKLSRKDGKFYRYILLFILFSIITLFLNKQFIGNYLIIFLLIVYGMKYIVKLKISLYDLLFVMIMFIFKVVIETPLFVLFYKLLTNKYIISIIISVIKILMIIFINKIYGIDNIYKKLNKLWKNNNFYIRYIFTILLFIYVILSFVFLVNKWL